MISLILGWGAPVTAIQLLIIKVVADGIPGFSLSVEPAEEKNMEKQPIHKYDSIFSRGLTFKILEISVVFTVVTLLAIVIGRTQSVAIAETMTFIVLGLSTISHMYNCRSEVSILRLKFLGNPLLVLTTAIGALIIVLLVTILWICYDWTFQLAMGSWFIFYSSSLYRSEKMDTSILKNYLKDFLLVKFNYVRL